MLTVEALKAEIVTEFGFFPPFFKPALATPLVLENLWRQTASAYIGNPLPALFKEMLAALFARYCSVPYCLVCHASSLPALGMQPKAIYELLQQPPLTDELLARNLAELEAGPLSAWPEPGSQAEAAILACCMAIFLEGDATNCRAKLRNLVGPQNFNHLMIFISYNKTALAWAEAHPDLSFAEDRRAIDNFGPLLAGEPRLKALFLTLAAQQPRAKPDSRWHISDNPTPQDTARSARLSAQERSSLSRAILDCTPQGLWGLSLDGKITFVNQATLRLFGYSREEEVLGQNAHNLFHHTHADGRPYPVQACPIYQAMPSGQRVVLRNETFWRRDGSSFHGEYRSQPIVIDGRLVGSVVSVTDSTDEHRAQRELENLFLLTGDLVAVMDGDFTIRKVNPAWTSVLGYSERDVVGRQLSAFLEAGDWSSAMPTKAAIKGEQTRIRGESRGRHKDGEPRWLSWTVVLHRGSESLYLIASDITDFKARQAAAVNKERLRAEAYASDKRKLQRLFAQAPVAICVLSGPEHLHTVINTQHEILFGTGQHLLGRPVREALPGAANSRFHDSLEQAFRSGQAFEGKEFAIERQDERGLVTRLYLNFILQPVLGLDNRVADILVVAYDVTDLMQARLAQERSSRELSALVEKLTEERSARERFVSTLTHDLRTPIAAANLTAQSVLHRASHAADEQLSARLSKAVKRIVKCTDRADSMIRDLLDANRISGGDGVSLKVAEAELVEVVKNVLEDAKQLHGDRFRMQCAPGATAHGHFDSQALQRVFENLLNNAAKYGNQQAPITARLQVDGGWAHVAVHNEGPTISAQDQKQLFEPYRRSLSAQQSGQSGWGIGLTLVKGLVEAHGGEVGVNSSQATGTTFSVHIPLDARPAAE